MQNKERKVYKMTLSLSCLVTVHLKRKLERRTFRAHISNKPKLKEQNTSSFIGTQACYLTEYRDQLLIFCKKKEKFYKMILSLSCLVTKKRGVKIKNCKMNLTL